MTSCSAWQLYVIIDRTTVRRAGLAAVAASAIRGGADVIQLRDKTASARELITEASRLRALTEPAGIPLVINDRADVALAAGAAGVHLGQDDLSLQDARTILGPHRLIGKSTHSLDQAIQAEREGADYIGVGPIFSTPTKPDYGSVGLGLIRQVASAVSVPVVCIGGIERQNLAQVLAAGARCVAVVRAVCLSPDPEATTRGLKTLVTEFHPTTASR